MIKRTRTGNLLAMAPSEIARESESAKLLLDQGACLSKGAFSREEVANLVSDINEVYAQYKPDETIGENRVHRHCILNKSAICQEALLNSCIRQTLSPLLGADFHVIANTAWRQIDPIENCIQGDVWHCDAGPHIPLPKGVTWPKDVPHPVFVVGVHIFLMDCNIEDGPTAFVPYSHLSGKMPKWTKSAIPEEMLSGIYEEGTNTGMSSAGGANADPEKKQELEVVPLMAKAGDVAFFISDVWHRRLPTLDGNHGRFFLQAHFARRDIAQRLVPASESNQLSQVAVDRAISSGKLAAKTIAGLHDIGFYDS